MKHATLSSSWSGSLVWICRIDYHPKNYEGRPTATALVRRGSVVVTIGACAWFGRPLAARA